MQRINGKYGEDYLDFRVIILKKREPEILKMMLEFPEVDFVFIAKKGIKDYCLARKGLPTE